jgi:hypothetical protein
MTLEQHQKTVEEATGKPTKDVMRREYRELTDIEKLDIGRIKDMGLDFINECDRIGESRELSLAKTKMEEAVFWAVKHLTR